MERWDNPRNYVKPRTALPSKNQGGKKKAEPVIATKKVAYIELGENPTKETAEKFLQTKINGNVKDGAWTKVKDEGICKLAPGKLPWIPFRDDEGRLIFGAVDAEHLKTKPKAQVYQSTWKKIIETAWVPRSVPSQGMPTRHYGVKMAHPIIVKRTPEGARRLPDTVFDWTQAVNGPSPELSKEAPKNTPKKKAEENKDYKMKYLKDGDPIPDNYAKVSRFQGLTSFNSHDTRLIWTFDRCPSAHLTCTKLGSHWTTGIPG